MREIKFRAWDKKIGRWVKNDNAEFDYWLIWPKGGIELIDCDDGQKNGFHEHCVSYIKDRFILSQYTGLKDKNGKEIYEGDILDRCGVVKHADRVQFISGMFVVHSEYNIAGYVVNTISLNDYINNLIDGCEVIGNIYESKDLLE